MVARIGNFLIGRFLPIFEQNRLAVGRVVAPGNVTEPALEGLDLLVERDRRREARGLAIILPMLVMLPKRSPASLAASEEATSRAEAKGRATSFSAVDDKAGAVQVNLSA